MRNSRNKIRCEKIHLQKCADGICRTYTPIQRVYAEMLEQDSSVQEFKCNVSLPAFELTDGLYTTDFVITKTNGDIAVRECILREYINRPFHIRLLDASREYWLRRGIQDWGIVTNEDKRHIKG